MSEPSNKNTATESKTPTTKKKAPATKKAAGSKGVSKMWLVAGVLVILALGGINIYYMKKNKELKKQLEEKGKSTKDPGARDVDGRESDNRGAHEPERQTPEQQNAGN